MYTIKAVPASISSYGEQRAGTAELTTLGNVDQERFHYINIPVTILMATAVSVLGRSLTFGLSLALAWFPVDNIGTIFLYLAYRLTHSDFWLNVSAYLLGPNLNVMPKALITSAKTEIFTIGAQPYVKVDGAHTLWVTLVYAVIFVVVAIVLTWRRDVKE